MSLLSQVSLHAFIQENAIRTETGELLDFHKYRFMFDIYSDRSRLVCAKKCAQIGFTTFEIIKTAHECANEGIDIVYVLPTDNDVKTFSGGKTNKIISQNPIFDTWTKDKDSVEQKQFVKNTIYYRGSWTNRAALSFTAKKLVVDEYDRCKQDIVEQYDSRLQSVADPRKAFFSNPSLPDFGIDRWYKISDQKKFNINHSCGGRFIMDEGCIDYENELYICPLCKKEITDEERRMGEWYNKDDVKWTGEIAGPYEWSGWWIPLWIAPWMSAKQISQMKKEKTPEFFANFVAGEAYINSTDALSQKALEKCLTDEVNSQEGRVIIGIDSGHNLHYTMLNKQGIFYHGYCPSVAEMGFKPGYDPYDEIEKRMLEYPNSIVMADQGGDLIGIRKLQAKYKGRVFLVHSVKETRTQQLIRWGDDEEYGKVLIDRNRVMQLTVDQLNDNRLSFNGSLEDWQPFFEHALNIYRVKEITGEANDPQYGWKWVWKRKGPDHWFLSMVYALVGLDRYAEDLATIISKKGPLSDIPVGTDAHGAVTGQRLGVRVNW